MLEGDPVTSSSSTAAPAVCVVGAGLAGAEAAWQAAQRGVRVTLCEMRPHQMTPVHRTGLMAELVCSNSLGSNLPDRALGLLKAELRRLASRIIACADATALPAGDALAVGRDAFAQAVTQSVIAHPYISVQRGEVAAIPAGLPTVIATGPLTSSRLADCIRSLAGEDHLFFYDAMAPVVTAASIDMGMAFRANRQHPGSGARRQGADLAAQPGASPASPSGDDGDYINCPLTREGYYAFVAAVKAADKIPLRYFEQDEASQRYFEACLPIEVLAARHPDALAFGPMTPRGLRDPRSGRRPYAVVQLRQDNAAGDLYNLVGFQTSLRWGDQERVLRMIPGLQAAEFVRLGQMHRNTYINSPRLLRPTLQWQGRDDLFFAGQIIGTEGYVGSTASGLLAGLNAARLALGLPLVTLPPTTMLGALCRYVTQADSAGSFQPMKANFGLLPALDNPVRDKRQRHAAYAERALRDLEVALVEQNTDSSRFQRGKP